MKKNGLIALITALLLLSGCATTDQYDNPNDELRTSYDLTASQKRALNHLNLAIGYYQQRQWPSALEDIKKALQADPNMADAYDVRALIYMEIGETKLAEENFLRALSMSPNNPDYSNNYGWFLCQNGRAEQSISYFEKAFKNRSYDSPDKAFNNAGMCSLKLKNVAAAEQYFLKAFQIEPRNPITDVNLARIYLDRKDYERARFYIGRVKQFEVLNAPTLWAAIKIQRKLGDRDAETNLVVQLEKRYPNSPEYAAFRREAFDE